jgi:hypothetical protein
LYKYTMWVIVLIIWVILLQGKMNTLMDSDDE